MISVPRTLMHASSSMPPKIPEFERRKETSWILLCCGAAAILLAFFFILKT